MISIQIFLEVISDVAIAPDESDFLSLIHFDLVYYFDLWKLMVFHNYLELVGPPR